MEKFINITQDADGANHIEFKGYSSVEAIGVLRYFEKALFTKSFLKQEALDKKRKKPNPPKQ